MIIQHQLAYLCFMWLFIYGVMAGAVLGVFKFIFLFFKNIWAKNILDFLYVLCFGFLFFIALNIYNYGQFRLILLFAFGLGCFVEQKTLGKLFAKIFLLVYNKLTKVWCKFKNSRLGLTLLK